MRVYLLEDPATPARFARFTHLGTWTDGHICKSCGGLVGNELIEPLKIEWDEGTAEIGSFSWCGYTCIVTEATRCALQDYAVNCKWGKVVVMPPAKKGKRSRVSYPYCGPELHWLLPRSCLSLNCKRSGLGVPKPCSVCGRSDYEFNSKRLVVSSPSLDDPLVFSIREYANTGAIYVTESMLQIMNDLKLTNLRPKQVGVLENSRE